MCRNNNTTSQQIPLDTIMEDLKAAGAAGSYVDGFINTRFSTTKNVPLRYILIANAFINRLSLEELNATLQDHGYDALYARNLWEATLIYAFNNELSYEAWKELEDRCSAYMQLANDQDPLSSGGTLTMSSLRAYLDQTSDDNAGIRRTRHVTRLLQREITENEDTPFERWLDTNISLFSNSREKTRYYFCKYLLYYLEAIEDDYVDSFRSGSNTADISSRAPVFKIQTNDRINDKKMSEKELRSEFETCAISPPGLFIAFNLFYFNYVNMSWEETQMEFSEAPELLDEDVRDRIIASLKKHNRRLRDKTDEEIFEWVADKIEQEEAEADEIYSRSNGTHGYQRGRSYGNAIRDYVQGSLDIDRISLISFLVFFGSYCKLDNYQAITADRLDQILVECRYEILDPDKDFDNFIIRFLNASDRYTVLIKEIERLMLDEKNFYLYRMYLMSEKPNKYWRYLMSQ